LATVLRVPTRLSNNRLEIGIPMKSFKSGIAVKSRLFGWLPGTMLLAAVTLAQAGNIRYTIAEIETLGGTENFAFGINNRGDVVGMSRTAGDASTYSFLLSAGAITSLSPLNSGDIRTVGPTGINDDGLVASGVMQDGVYFPAIYDSRSGQITGLGSLGGVTSFGFSGVATSINDLGQAAGYSYLDAFNRHAFVYSDGLMTDIGSFGGYSGALDINNRGEVAGFASDSVAGYAHAFVYRDGVMTEIDPFGGPNNESYAEEINIHGQVVGYGLNADGSAFRGFVYSADGSIVDVGTLKKGRNSYAFSINDRNRVVGVADYPYRSVCSTPRGNVRCVKFGQHGFLFEGGVMTDLNALIDPALGWDVQWVFDINNNGQIAGYGVLDGKFRAFVMTPKARKAIASSRGTSEPAND